MNMRLHFLRCPILCDCHPRTLASIPHCLLRLNRVSKKQKKKIVRHISHDVVSVDKPINLNPCYFSLFYGNVVISSNEDYELVRRVS